MMNITEINVYPIKSLRGTSVAEAPICNHGLDNDRSWMLVDSESKRLTQREWPRLSTLVPRVENGGLRVQAPDKSDIVVSNGGNDWSDELLTVDLWGHEHTGIVATERVNRAFSDAAGMSCRLLSLAHDTTRANGVPFHDDAPLLIISRSSLEELNRRMPAPLPMNRFRPSVVVAGSGAFAEDEWQRITIGETEFTAVKLCVRCSITTIDQAQGEFRGPEPLKTLATFRRLEQNVAFGAYFRPVNPGGKLRVGDELTVLKRKSVAPVFESRATAQATTKLPLSRW
jgi:uncharacterized protein YcbX